MIAVSKNSNSLASRIIVFSLLALILLTLPALATQFSYNANNRLKQMDLGQGRVITYSYDIAGNLVGRSTSFPCFDWNMFMAHVNQWPENDVSVLDLIGDVDCSKAPMTARNSQ